MRHQILALLLISIFGAMSPRHSCGNEITKVMDAHSASAPQLRMFSVSPFLHGLTTKQILPFATALHGHLTNMEKIISDLMPNASLTPSDNVVAVAGLNYLAARPGEQESAMSLAARQAILSAAFSPGAQASLIEWLNRSEELNPNFAMGQKNSRLYAHHNGQPFYAWELTNSLNLTINRMRPGISHLVNDDVMAYARETAARLQPTILLTKDQLVREPAPAHETMEFPSFLRRGIEP
jgi:hypothetical protein